MGVSVLFCCWFSCFLFMHEQMHITCVCVCMCLPVRAQHHPCIHLQCHVGHYDNGCNCLPPGAPQSSHYSLGGRPARCATPLPSPKGNCLSDEWPFKLHRLMQMCVCDRHISCKHIDLRPYSKYNACNRILWRYQSTNLLILFLYPCFVFCFFACLRTC